MLAEMSVFFSVYSQALIQDNSFASFEFLQIEIMSMYSTPIPIDCIIIIFLQIFRTRKPMQGGSRL